MVLLDFKITLLIIVTGVIVIYGINRNIKEPYMDEIFHIPQTQTFCKGKWNEYHEKITTFPGLYIIPALISFIPMVSCSMIYLRCFNVIYVVLCIPIIREIIWELHGEYIIAKLVKAARQKTDGFNKKYGDSLKNEIELQSNHFDDMIDTVKNHFTVEIILFPLNYFYVFMFYTDIPSTFWLLVSYFCYLKLFKNSQSIHDLSKQICAFILGFIAILHRQTNVIWIGFYFLLSIYDIYILNKTKKINRTQFSKQRFNIYNLIVWCWHNKYLIISTLWYYELLFIGFVLFVIVNGSIVLGDKTHHEFGLHLAQILYLIGLLLSFTMLPSIIKDLYDLMRKKQINVGKIKQFMKSHLIICVILFVLFTVFRYKFTVIHDFLLSDNRHYSFYIWRYFLSKKWFSIILIPITTFGTVYIYYELRGIAGISIYWCLSFVVCCCMTLIPTPLFEFRYFIIPIIIFKLNYLCNDELMDRFVNDCVVDQLEGVYNQYTGTMTLPLLNFVFNKLPTANVFKWTNLIMYVVIDILTLYVYIAKPFTWGDGTVARFMW